jgi:hypothetical protein
VYPAHAAKVTFPIRVAANVGLAQSGLSEGLVPGVTNRAAGDLPSPRPVQPCKDRYAALLQTAISWSPGSLATQPPASMMAPSAALAQGADWCSPAS